MTKQERTDRLRALMRAHKLSAPAVADLLDRKAQTVRSWSCQYPHRAIPETTLALLELKLGADSCPAKIANTQTPAA